MDIAAAEEYILEQLEKNLAPDLFYHSIHHVLDVTREAMSIAAQEMVTDAESLGLLRTAALYHDAGFMHTYTLHEEAGCRIVHEVLPGFGYRADQIGIICGMIMATKIPQNPSTLREKIICDADLDYLGRDDFKTIGDKLFRELNVRGKMPDLTLWNAAQIQFLSAHEFHTNSSRKNRGPVKQKHLDVLKGMIE